jgi:hypothetical protein
MATGGTTSTAGGAATTGGKTGTGGAGGACSSYSGTVSKDSTIFKDGFGTSTLGKWTGYLFSYSFGSAIISPNGSSGSSCFKSAKACVAGTVPADYSSGAALGWYIGQASGASINTPVALTGAVKLTVAGAVAGLRVNLMPGDFTAMNYCYTLTAADATAIASGLTIPVSSFKQQCYDPGSAVAYSNAPIGSIQLEVPGDQAGAKPFDFCIIDIEPS